MRVCQDFLGDFRGETLQGHFFHIRRLGMSRVETRDV